MLGRGHTQDRNSGPGPRVGATATPSPMAVGIIKAETRGEAAGRKGGGSKSSPLSKRRKFKPKPEWKRKGVMGGGESGIRPSSNLRPQVGGVNVPLTPSPCLLKPHGSLESVLPGLCKMRRKTSGEGRAESQSRTRAGAPPTLGNPSPPPEAPPRMAIPGWVLEILPKLRSLEGDSTPGKEPQEAGRLSLEPGRQW